MDRSLARTLAVALLLCAAPGAHAAQLNVDSTVDSTDTNPGDGKCVSKAGGCTLRAAIEEANATTLSDTIMVPAGTYVLNSPDEGPNYAQSGPLFLNGEVEVIGAGATSTIIDGGGKARVFETQLNSVISLSGLTIRNGLANGADGGGILSRGHLKLSDVTLDGNRSKTDPQNANGRGGALFVAEGSDAKLLDVRITNNTADGRGGGVYNDGSLQIMNGTVRGNASLTDDGGGICNSGTLKLLITEVDGNRATNGGGIDNVEGSVEITDSTLAANTASSSGGAIFNSGTVTAVNSTISGNTAGGSGGGILNRAQGTVALNNVTIASNRAGSGGDAKGGGIANDGTGAVTVANSIIAANTAANGADCAGVLTSQGYNLLQSDAGCSIAGDTAGNVIGKDAQLAVLADNDGPTRTQAPAATSPAIDGGNPGKPTGRDGTCAPADQRGKSREAGRCDIGAYETTAAAAAR
ncbi:MAG TPA: choice-of-anchor Q domain-containing protein [Candidatus Binatia bacterium]